MTPKGTWPRSCVLLLKQRDRNPRSTECISCCIIKLLSASEWLFPDTGLWTLSLDHTGRILHSDPHYRLHSQVFHILPQNPRPNSTCVYDCTVPGVSTDNANASKVSISTSFPSCFHISNLHKFFSFEIVGAKTSGGRHCLHS